MDHDLVMLECRVLVRDDAYLPAGRVRNPLVVGDGEGLGRGLLLPAFAEGTRAELRLRRGLQAPAGRAGPLFAAGSDDYQATRERVAPELVRQLAGSRRPSARSRNGRMRSMGAGKTIVVDCEPPSSSSVWR